MAEASTFYLEIITPERQFYIGPAEALVFPAVDGEMGVYPGHEPAVTAVEPGELRYKVDGKWEPAAVGAGFVEIKPDYVILLVGCGGEKDAGYVARKLDIVLPQPA
ncbi:F0F1 ATP synthase subunit epsilon, partial [Flavonifractor plautii]|uniref:F0F1 ATP synthase subunit epsilon n=1 Tax=Flavonifractor plautii TaxID=292800 RepID=UPI001FAB51D9